MIYFYNFLEEKDRPNRILSYRKKILETKEYLPFKQV